MKGMSLHRSTQDLYQPTKDLDARLKAIRESIDFARCPPEGFDPLNARTEELDGFWLPPRPDPRTRPTQHRFWKKLFSPDKPLRFVEPRFCFQKRHRERAYSGRRVAVSTGRSGSLNWSGAFIAPRDGRMFTEVHGSWKVPDVSPPADAPVNAEYDSSIWIGLDGQREYLDSSLPQIGTAQYLKMVDGDPTATTTIWWQWWLEDHWNPPPITLRLAVNPGDEVMCSLTVVSETHVKYLIMNHSTGEMCCPFVVPAPVATLPPASSPVRRQASSPVQLKVSGGTAQWVVERPTIWLTENFYELPDYGTVEFSDCHALSALAPGQPGREETLEGDTLIYMYMVKTNPHRTVIVSEAERLGTDRVKMSYQG